MGLAAVVETRLSLEMEGATRAVTDVGGAETGAVERALERRKYRRCEGGGGGCDGGEDAVQQRRQTEEDQQGEDAGMRLVLHVSQNQEFNPIYRPNRAYIYTRV
jgi:hypothetical protein